MILCAWVLLEPWKLEAVEPSLIFHVAPDGDDSQPGSPERPFRTLEAARDAIRRTKQSTGRLPGSVVIAIHPGEHRREQTFVLSAQDSGTADRPVIYRAVGGRVTLTGGIRIPSFQFVQGAGVQERLPASVSTHVVVCDLVKLGITNVPRLELGGFGSGRGFRTYPILELFFNDRPMPMACWPNEGFARTGPVTGPRTRTAWDGRPGSAEGRFQLEGDRLTRWTRESDLWLYGYWFWDWADSYEKVERLNVKDHTIELAEPWHRYGYREGQPYRAVHVLAELDEPGEWYLDRQRLRLFFWPPGDLQAAKTELSLLASPLVMLDGVSHVQFEGISWECGAGDGAVLIGGESVRFEGCRWRNLGGQGVEIRGGRRHEIVSCDFEDLGRGGIRLSGGERQRLERGSHRVENCRFARLSRIDRTYTPGTWVEGVGHLIRHNLFHDLASSALRVDGNDHLVELNEACRVVLESDDQGAVDMWGDPTYRGNVFRFNYWHHIGPDEKLASIGHRMRAGIRLDDAICGVWVYGNVFQSCGPRRSHFGAVQIHGGRDNRIEANLFVDTPAAVSFTPWGSTRWLTYASNAWATAALERDLYLKQYPELIRMWEGADANAVRSNVTVRCPKLLLRAPEAVFAESNTEHPNDPAFRPGSEGRLRWDAADARRLGVDHIPFDRIGLFEDRWRVRKGSEWRHRALEP
ncbi:MAG: right-handed parallel beta-helix repeat-containing protein [Verrucomicrobiota bacterium]|nr:right-handed parallel beta-helix repeat-containing protein [Verrucomicrobiota bacterium]